MQLRHNLSTRFPEVPAARLPGGFDRVGDIAVVIIPPELEPHEREIGAIILALHSTIRVVAKRDGQYGGEYRTLPLRIIAGEERLTTLHRENGISLHLDLGQVYFSVRSAHERARIADLVEAGETVAVLCSGVGPFPLIIGRHSRASEVIGIEKNPAAHAYALRNLKANRNIAAVRFLEGDAARILPSLDRLFDRILIVLPHGGEALLPCALEALRPGGTLHFYDMQVKGCHHAAAAKVEAACRRKNRRMTPIRTITCGRCGPTLHRVCLDAVIEAAQPDRDLIRPAPL
jgi:tRNA (guanine37-N1)-methyltransferase